MTKLLTLTLIIISFQLFGNSNVEKYTTTLKVHCIKLKTIKEKFCAKEAVKTVEGEPICSKARGRGKSKRICKRNYKKVKYCAKYSFRNKKVPAVNPTEGYIHKKEYKNKTCYAYIDYK